MIRANSTLNNWQLSYGYLTETVCADPESQAIRKHKEYAVQNQYISKRLLYKIASVWDKIQRHRIRHTSSKQQSISN